ncbi:hypothetical protein L345_09812, partial [Ophiophagus hannah]
MKQMLLTLHGQPQGDSLPQKQRKTSPEKSVTNPLVQFHLPHEDGNTFAPKPTVFVNKGGSSTRPEEGETNQSTLKFYSREG